MSGIEIAPDDLQPAEFAFSDEYRPEVERAIAKYPEQKKQSAVMPLLDLAQRQHGGWIPRAAVEHIADLLEMPSIRVWEVATFYTMYFLAPKGARKVQVCTTTPCWLRGSDEVVAACKEKLGIGFGETTPDGAFSLHEVECLGACVSAPMMRVDDDYYEDLDRAAVERILDAFKAGETPEPGPQNARRGSEPLKV